MALQLKERWGRLNARLSNAEIVVRLRTMLDSLSPRDRRLLILMVSALGLVIILVSGMAARTHLQRLRQEISRKEGQLQRIEQIKGEYETLKGQLAQLEEAMKQDTGFNLTSFLEKKATEVGISESINIQTKGEVATGGFKEVTVEVRLRKATLEKIVRYLYAVEHAPQRLTAKSMRIRTGFGNREELDLDLEVSYLSPQES